VTTIHMIGTIPKAAPSPADSAVWPTGMLYSGMRASLFVTCFNDTLFPQTGRAVVRLLERLGCEVDFPLEQTCCGQMHMNSGYAREGAALARRFARVFDGAEHVVCPSASCVGMLRHQVDAPVHELSEFVIDVLGVEDVGASFPHRVTFHPTCHSLRELGVGDRPMRLLRAVKGIELVELPEARECCGFGGTFAVKNAEVSSAMLSDKVRAVLDTQAEIVCAADNSCLLHIGGALSRQRTGVRTMHLAEVLAS
jgi:L-lactate dehydrogenase complex protein LldE